MSIIKTLDNYENQSPTQSDFPALMHFFKCDETGGTYIEDSINGVQLSPSGTFTPTGEVVSILQTTSLALTSGSWETPGTKNVVMFMMTDTYFGSSYFEVGVSSSDGGYSWNGINAGNGDIEVRDGTTAVETTTAYTITPGTAAMIGFTATPGGNLVTFEYGSAWDGSVDTQDMSAITTIDSIEDTFTCNVQPLRGLAIMHFTTLPTDLGAAITWMSDQWAQNNKVIWPGWMNRT